LVSSSNLLFMFFVSCFGLLGCLRRRSLVLWRFQ